MNINHFNYITAKISWIVSSNKCFYEKQFIFIVYNVVSYFNGVHSEKFLESVLETNYVPEAILIFAAVL